MAFKEDAEELLQFLEKNPSEMISAGGMRFAVYSPQIMPQLRVSLSTFRVNLFSPISGLTPPQISKIRDIWQKYEESLTAAGASLSAMRFYDTKDHIRLCKTLKDIIKVL